MINREATIRWKGYDPDDLKPQTKKKVWANCDECGIGRWVRMDTYRDLCVKCAAIKRSENPKWIENNKEAIRKMVKTCKRTEKIIKCKICGESKKHHAHGMCSNCYKYKWSEDHPEEKRESSVRYREKQSDYHGGMKDNKDCPHYLGITVAERVLSKIFKNVQRMSTHNPGYDFICGKGFKIDVKSGCRRERENRSNWWVFNINHNIIADHFLCLAFDNRKNLNPEHIWLIPRIDINDKGSITITESKLYKWSKYELDKLDDIIKCCNTIKGVI